MKRGRPAQSVVRQNMVEIVAVKKQVYGYELFKIYLDIFPTITMRNIYYHLKKGIETGEFSVAKVEKQEGTYSWGPASEHTYYQLGAKAEPRGDVKVKEYFTSASVENPTT